METRAAYAVVGAFVLTLIAGLVVAALWLANAQFSQGKTRYDIYFASVSTGLVEGSPVRISGVQVGRVIGVVLEPNNPGRVRVTVEVVGDAPVRSDSVASIELTGITGGAAVEISPGTPNAPELQVQEGQRYAIIWSRDSEIQKVVANLPELLAKITDLSDRLASTVDEKNRAALAATLDNLSRVSAVAVARSAEIDHLIADSATDAKELQKTIANINAAVAHLDQVVIEAGGTVKDLDKVVKDNEKPLKEFTSNGLDELRQLIARAQGLVTAMTRAADSIERDPSLLLYGDRRQGYRPK
jgi:phospholipid/cholesterol/gamma-HCH transport system substrate-binding protein